MSQESRVVDTRGADDAFGALAQFFVHDGTLGDTLLQVAELACKAGPADMAGITLLVDGIPSTGVFTDSEAPEIDKAQYGSEQGPCLDAFRDQSAYRIESTAADTRWPEFARTAAHHGIRSTLSLPITARDESLGALNLYSRTEAAFRDADVERMMTFAAHSAFVLTNAQVYWDARHLNENLNQAMQSRATIDHAVGIVMATGGKNPQEAFQVLVKASQRQNRKLREIATEIVVRAETSTAT
jgi:GAF domain-containing protein